jgi:hypothetical protein
MRWRSTKFALFAVIAVAAGLAPGAFTPARAAAAATNTTILWREQTEKLQPSGQTKFFVRVESTSVPTGKITFRVDNNDPFDRDLKDDPDSEHPKAAITDDITVFLGEDPHYITAAYKPADANAFAPSTDDLGLAIGGMRVEPDQIKSNETATFTFTMVVNPATPADPQKRPNGRVTFSDEKESTTRSLSPSSDANRLEATWTVVRPPGRWNATAIYSPGSDFFQPVKAERALQVSAVPGETTSTTRRTATTKPKASGARTGTTAALAPINPATSTTLGPSDTTNITFGAFPTTPRPTTPVSKGNNEGPPIAVVVTTLLALGVLGGVAAFRRYRRSAIDWF